MLILDWTIWKLKGFTSGLNLRKTRTSRLNLEKHENLGPFSRPRTDSVIVLLRPTPSKFKLCSGSIVVEVSIAFYHVAFYFFFIFYFLTNHNFTVMYSFVVSIIRFFHFSSQINSFLHKLGFLCSFRGNILYNPWINCLKSWVRVWLFEGKSEAN